MSTDALHYLNSSPKLYIQADESITGYISIIFTIRKPDGETIFTIDTITVEDESIGLMWGRALPADFDVPGIYQIHALITYSGGFIFPTRLWLHEVSNLYEK